MRCHSILTDTPWFKCTHCVLQEEVLADGALERGKGRTLVFAGNVAAANEVASILTEAGLHPLLYHKDVSVETRANALATMRSR